MYRHAGQPAKERRTIVIAMLLCLTCGCRSVAQRSQLNLASAASPTAVSGPDIRQTQEPSASEVTPAEFEPQANSQTALPPGPDDGPVQDRGEARSNLEVTTLLQTYPIDLPTALRLGNANNLQIALARQRIEASLALLDAAEALSLPSLSAGPTYLRHHGNIQRASGEIIDQRRTSLWVGGGATLSVVLGDGIYEPLAAQCALQAETAAASAITNETLMRISDVYLELLAAHGGLEIARETMRNTDELTRLTREYAMEGVGLKSDAERAATELGSREQQILLAQERITVTSAELARLLRLDALTQLVPLESHVVAIDLIAIPEPLPNLVAHALSYRPELAEQQALMGVAAQKLRQATYGPLIPSIVLGYQAGAFGGGRGSNFSNFSDRGDFTASALWELRNLGMGDLAQRRFRESQLSQAHLRTLQIADRVASEVVSAHQVMVARHRQIEVAQRTVDAAQRSFELNLTRIRGGGGLPIEVLQSIQALDRARNDYLQAVTSYNKAQFRLLAALGDTPFGEDENT